MSIPAGWKLVPIVPTAEMVEAGNAAAHAGGCDLYQLKREVMNAWPAMLAAAPASETQGHDVCWVSHDGRLTFMSEQEKVRVGILHTGRLGDAFPATPPAVKAVDTEDWRVDAHVCNEWADMATNGVQWLRNIRDGVSTVDDALAEMESNAARITSLAALATHAEKGEGNGN